MWQEVGLYRMLTDWLRDPQRRRQFVWRCVESWAGALPLLIVALWLQPGRWPLLIAGWAIVPLVAWLVYEFILEPLRLTGPYWERTPAPGTTFKYW